MDGLIVSRSSFARRPVKFRIPLVGDTAPPKIGDRPIWSGSCLALRPSAAHLGLGKDLQGAAVSLFCYSAIRRAHLPLFSQSPQLK